MEFSHLCHTERQGSVSVAEQHRLPWLMWVLPPQHVTMASAYQHTEGSYHEVTLKHFKMLKKLVAFTETKLCACVAMINGDQNY